MERERETVVINQPSASPFGGLALRGAAGARPLLYLLSR